MGGVLAKYAGGGRRAHVEQVDHRPDAQPRPDRRRLVNKLVVRFCAVDAEDLNGNFRRKGCKCCRGDLADIAWHSSVWAVVDGINHQRAPYTFIVATTASTTRVLHSRKDGMVWFIEPEGQPEARPCGLGIAEELLRWAGHAAEEVERQVQGFSGSLA